MLVQVLQKADAKTGLNRQEVNWRKLRENGKGAGGGCESLTSVEKGGMEG